MTCAIQDAHPVSFCLELWQQLVQQQHLARRLYEALQLSASIPSCMPFQPKVIFESIAQELHTPCQISFHQHGQNVLSIRQELKVILWPICTGMHKPQQSSVCMTTA